MKHPFRAQHSPSVSPGSVPAPGKQAWKDQNHIQTLFPSPAFLTGLGLPILGGRVLGLAGRAVTPSATSPAALIRFHTA